MSHKFGGLWTQKKLAVLKAYLAFYTQALKGQRFKLHYADAFAGTGKHEPAKVDGQESLIPLNDLRGSVITALEIEPGFHEYHFNDLNPAHVAELQNIRAQHPGKNIRITEGDANAFVPEFCTRLGPGDRAVLLLDPYSTELDWETLNHVARSQKVDLWVLFPLSAVMRMTPKDKVMPEWKKKLDRMFGTDSWEAALYKPVTPSTQDLFEDEDKTVSQERLTTNEFQQWLVLRLKEIFPHVAQPLQLWNSKAPLFLFIFAVSNPKPQAWRLADKVASHIISKIGGH
jgi:three-Cys-motif partner protein